MKREENQVFTYTLFRNSLKSWQKSEYGLFEIIASHGNWIIHHSQGPLPHQFLMS